MADFPRTKPPADVSLPKVPPPLISRGQTGKVQTRAVNAVGRTWTESWGVLSAGNADVQALTSFIEDTYQQGTAITLTHYLLPGSGKAPNGSGGGTPVVNGPSQSGSVLVIDGFPTSATGVVAAGDVLGVAGLTQVIRSTSTVNASASGSASVTINPPIAVGGSPSDGAAITTTGVEFTAYIEDYTIPRAAPDEFMAGMTVMFRESV